MSTAAEAREGLKEAEAKLGGRKRGSNRQEAAKRPPRPRKCEELSTQLTTSDGSRKYWWQGSLEQAGIGFP